MRVILLQVCEQHTYFLIGFNEMIRLSSLKTYKSCKYMYWISLFDNNKVLRLTIDIDDDMLSIDLVHDCVSGHSRHTAQPGPPALQSTTGEVLTSRGRYLIKKMGVVTEF